MRRMKRFRTHKKNRCTTGSDPQVDREAAEDSADLIFPDFKMRKARSLGVSGTSSRHSSADGEEPRRKKTKTEGATWRCVCVSPSWRA